MGFVEIINNIITYLQTNIPIAIAAALLLVYLLFRKPKFFLTVFFIALLLAGLVYLVLELSSIGVSHKKVLINKGLDR